MSKGRNIPFFSYLGLFMFFAAFFFACNPAARQAVMCLWIQV